MSVESMMLNTEMSVENKTFLREALNRRNTQNNRNIHFSIWVLIELACMVAFAWAALQKETCPSWLINLSTFVSLILLIGTGVSCFLYLMIMLLAYAVSDKPTSKNLESMRGMLPIFKTMFVKSLIGNVVATVYIAAVAAAGYMLLAILLSVSWLILLICRFGAGVMCANVIAKLSSEQISSIQKSDTTCEPQVS